MRKRILSILLCLVMVVGLFPTMAFAAGGSGTASDPIVVTTFDELKAALEKDTAGLGMQYIKVPKEINIEKVLKLEIYNSAFNVSRQKTLIVDGTVTVIAAVGSAGVRSMFSVHGPGNRLDIRGSGSLTFKANTNASSNAVVDVNDEGMLNVSGGVTLSGTFNAAVYGTAVYNYGGTVNIDNATLTGETAGISYGGALYANGGTTNIKNATLKSSVAPRPNAIIRKEGTINVGKNASLTIENSIIHTTDGVTDGHSIRLSYDNTKLISNYLGTNQKIYKLSDNTQLNANVSSLTDSVNITDNTNKIIDAVGLTMKPCNTCETISDLETVSYNPDSGMELTGCSVFKGLKNTSHEIENNNTPYDPNEDYTVMYVFRAKPNYSFANDVDGHVSVSGGDFWQADTAGGTTNKLRVFVNLPAAAPIDEVSLTIKPTGERAKISDLEPVSYNPDSGMELTGCSIFKGLKNTSHKIENNNTPYDPNEDYTVMYVFRAKANYTFANDVYDHVTVYGGNFWQADTAGGSTTKLRVFVNFPREEVPHSIKIINGRGTANPTSAMAGATVTVTANDDTANNMMFTRWYTDTPGVTFANATQQETTFVMPDCDVKVSPGFQQVSFTKQPVPQISLEKGHGGKTSFVFSWDISKWELVDTATNQTVSSDNTSVKAGKLTDVTIPVNTDLGNKNYRIVVTTANGEQFKSNEFTVTWFPTMPAPLVEFSIPSDTKFIGELTVNVGCPSTLEAGGASPFETYYTTNGIDPKEADPSDIQRYSGRKDVTLTQTTHFMARTILEGEGSNADTWGELCEASYEKIDKLNAPTVKPESCSYSGSLPIIVTIQDVYNAEIKCTIKQHNGHSGGEDTVGSMLETWLPDSFCGTTEFRAKAIVYNKDDGRVLGESDEVTYTYTRKYWANISNATINGKVNEAIDATEVTITLDGEKFESVATGDDVSTWFNLPVGLTAKVKDLNSLKNGLTVTISGTPKATSADAITVTIPKNKLLANGTVDLTVLSNPKAVYNIGTDATHTHIYGTWTKWDDSEHYKSCTCGDMQFELHTFGNWTPDPTNADKHFKECTVCHYKVEDNHVESSKITGTPAGIGTPGTWHTECDVCGKPMNTGTFPALVKIDVAKLTVAKPVKDAAAEIATTGDSTYTVANTVWTAADGATLTIGDKFQPGTAYTVKITLEAKNSNVFTADSTYNKIEGKDAKLVTAVTGYTDSVILTYTFDKTAGGYHPGTGTGTGVTTYPITVKSAKNGDVTASHKSASKGTTVTLTVDPDKGYVLDTLTVLDGKDKEIKLTEKNGKYTFTMPASKVTVEAMFKAAGNNPFTDVPAGSYYEDAVIWAVDKGITTGTSATTFNPNGICTRAQAVTFLWRAAGSPAAKSAVMPFTDVKAGSYYYDAVLWAVEQGITKGTSETMFSPDATCTRAQIVTFLWRANGSPDASGNSAFTDVASDAYYAAAVTWAEKNGVTGGIGGGLFGSNNNCTRAQIVTFIWRSMK